MVAARPKFSQRTFDHIQSLLRRVASGTVHSAYSEHPIPVRISWEYSPTSETTR